jgi:hypothetical protein
MKKFNCFVILITFLSLNSNFSQNKNEKEYRIDAPKFLKVVLYRLYEKHFFKELTFKNTSKFEKLKSLC